MQGGGYNNHVNYVSYTFMLNKRIYKRAIAISNRDLDYIKSLRQVNKFRKKSLAGINSVIIREYKLSLSQTPKNNINKISRSKSSKIRSFTANAILQPQRPRPCKHERFELICGNDFVVKICAQCRQEIKNPNLENDFKTPHSMVYISINNSLPTVKGLDNTITNIY